MSTDETVTRFLNVDLDLGGRADDLKIFLESIEPSIIVLYHAEREASIELGESFHTLEETVWYMVEFVRALSPDDRAIWDRLAFRRLNVGIQAAGKPYAEYFALSARTVELIAALRFEILFTVYAPRAD
jgi:hypothetical protein